VLALVLPVLTLISLVAHSVYTHRITPHLRILGAPETGGRPGRPANELSIPTEFGRPGLASLSNAL